MNSNKGIVLLVILGIGAAIANSSFFIVNENQAALRLQLGEIVDSSYEPGLHFKLPVVQNAQTFDRRIQTLDLKAERFLTVEKKFVVVDSYAKWRISDVAQYFRSTRGSQTQTDRLLYLHVATASS